jgi:hypothetical protein
MELIPLGDVEQRYTSMTSIDYGAGGQNRGRRRPGCGERLFLARYD